MSVPKDDKPFSINIDMTAIAPWNDVDAMVHGDTVVTEHVRALPWDSAPTGTQPSVGVPIAGVPARGTGSGVPAIAGVSPGWQSERSGYAEDRPRDSDMPVKGGRPLKYPDLAARYLPHDKKGYRNAALKRDRESHRAIGQEMEMTTIK